MICPLSTVTVMIRDMEIDEVSNEKLVYKCKILDNVANSNAFFKSQQIGEDDLTFEEKRKIAEDLMSRNITLFLQRYHKFLNVDDLPYFEDVKSDYEVDFYLKEIIKHSNKKKVDAIVKNRRYEALKQLRNEGSYFSDCEMRHRNPYMYEQLIGRYLTDDERSALNKKTNEHLSFSSFLVEQIGRSHDEHFLRNQKDTEDAAVEENDSDDDDDFYEEDIVEEPSVMTRQILKLPEAEKEMLRMEFISSMYESFLSGKDRNFDYSTVDENSEYDSVNQREIDEEEQYFDKDS